MGVVHGHPGYGVTGRESGEEVRIGKGRDRNARGETPNTGYFMLHTLACTYTLLPLNLFFILRILILGNLKNR